MRTHADSHILLASSSKDCMTVVLQGIFTGQDRKGQVFVCMVWCTNEESTYIATRVFGCGCSCVHKCVSVLVCMYLCVRVCISLWVCACVSAYTRSTIFPTNIALMQVALIAALCCAALICSVVAVVVVACFCYIPYWLPLMLTLLFAPCILTFASCACGVSFLSTGENIPLAQVVVVTSWNLWYTVTYKGVLFFASTCGYSRVLSSY